MCGYYRFGWTTLPAVALLVVSLSGCTSFHDYIHNGFKVGPNYCPPKAPVAEHWIDAADVRQPADTESLARWWTVFNDPKLNYLVACAYRQNLTLREAGFRVLQARAQLGDCPRQSVSAESNRLGQLLSHGSGRGAQRRRGDEILRPVELRLQSPMGT